MPLLSPGLLSHLPFLAFNDLTDAESPPKTVGRNQWRLLLHWKAPPVTLDGARDSSAG